MGRRPGQPPLTHERIVSTALQVIDIAGLDSLSMRRLGRELGVDPMAIYYHVPNKDDLLTAVVRHLFAAMAVPAPAGSWQQRVRQWARAYREVALAHPNLVLRIVAMPAAVAAAAVTANESLYAALDEAGLSAAEVVMASDLVVDYVNGYLLGHAGGAPTEAAVEAFFAELEAQPPESVRTQRRLLADPDLARGRDSFTYGLDVVLAGLAAGLDTGVGADAVAGAGTSTAVAGVRSQTDARADDHGLPSVG
jgi:AcrR family transcriptional regulator